MGVRAAAKVFVVRQLDKESISPGRGDIPRLHCLLSRHLDGRRANPDYM